MKHMKRLAAPSSWPVERKKTKFLIKPVPGPNNMQVAMPIGMILRDILGYTKTTRETKKVLNAGKVLINNMARKDHRFPVGIFDSISIPEMGKFFTMLFNQKGKLMLSEIGKNEALSKIRKITGKTMLKKARMQLNFFDGSNLIVKDGSYKVGDSVIVEGKNVKKHLKLDKGAFIYLTAGKHIGAHGIVEEIQDFDGMQESRIIFRQDNNRFTTLKKYAYVIEKEKTK